MDAWWQTGEYILDVYVCIYSRELISINYHGVMS